MIQKRFDGVIAHLTHECGRNVHDKGIVNVTVSSAANNRLPGKRGKVSGKTVFTGQNHI